MQLFIDSNIYLNYFRASSENLASLRALIKLLKQKKVALLVPEQTLQEYERNRSQVIEETRSKLSKQQEGLELNSVPPTIKSAAEITKIKKKFKAVKMAIQGLIKKYDSYTAKEKTDADILIASMIKIAKILPENKEILDMAHSRYLKGNPPRKSDYSYGDAITWETLLACATSDDLTIVTHDADYKGQQSGKPVLHQFLQKEWAKRSKNKISFYESLGEFVNQFEKKKTIEKRVIVQEKSPLWAFPGLSTSYSVSSPTGTISASPSLYSSTGMSVSSSLSSSPFAGISIGSSLSPSTSTVHYSLSTCNSCSAIIIDHTAKYCSKCGKKL